MVHRYIESLTVNVLFFQSHRVFHSQDSFPFTLRPWLWETSSGVVSVDVFAREARRAGEGILRMEEDAVTSEEEDAMTSDEEDIESQDFDIPTDHGHLARNCLMKIMSALNALDI